MKNNYRLYKITNQINGKAYIGFTKNTLEWRWIRHCTGASPTSIIYQAIKKYGKPAFTIEEIGQADNRNEAAVRERELIVLHRTFMPAGYNMTPGGEGNDAPRSAETRARMKASWYPREWSEESKANRKAKMTGRKHPQEQTDRQRGKMIGQKRSPEMRAKMRKIALSRTPQDIRRARNARWNSGNNKLQLELDLYN